MKRQKKVLVVVATAVMVAFALAVPVSAQIHAFEAKLKAQRGGGLSAQVQSLTPVDVQQTFLDCVECIFLDTYDPLNTPPGDLIAHTATVLKGGTPYLITIQGTYSVWPLYIWVGLGQGAPEPAPQFPSPGGENGLVVSDWEYLFAHYSPVPPLVFPIRLPFESVSLDGGLTYQVLIPLGGPVYNGTDHVYQYLVEGQGNQAFFRKHDAPTNDNYGQFKICVQVVTSICTNNDCNNGGASGN